MTQEIDTDAFEPWGPVDSSMADLHERMVTGTVTFYEPLRSPTDESGTFDIPRTEEIEEIGDEFVDRLEATMSVVATYDVTADALSTILTVRVFCQRRVSLDHVKEFVDRELYTAYEEWYCG